MKALCVKQPWAELIASGRKTWEMRTWSTSYRGPVLLLASAQPARSDSASKWHEILERCPLYGCTVAIAELHNVRPITRRGYDPRACCDVSQADLAWELRNVVRVPAITVKGRLGLFPAEREWLRALVEHQGTPYKAIDTVVEYL